MFEIRVGVPDAQPQVFALQGIFQIGFESDRLNDRDRPDSISRIRRSFSINGELREQNGSLQVLSAGSTGTVVVNSTSRRSNTVTVVLTGDVCTFVHEFKRDDTITLAASGQRNTVDIGLVNGVVTLEEFTVRGPTSTRRKTSATLVSTEGRCQDVDTSPPLPTDEAIDLGPISRNELMSLTPTSAYTANVVTNAAGRRSVSLSGSTSNSLPRNGNGETITQSSSATITLVDTQQ